MADGMGCKCAAYSAAECGCGVDWTPQIVYDQQDEIQRLKDEVYAVTEHNKVVRKHNDAMQKYLENLGELSNFNISQGADNG